ncbi:uncharacterized protein ColSpa_11082 [Colletotrichum spaethianum]|uniref:Uncharacterized protein n=1 Tax=Colletotrichum spaethianum TaxID=700344 RepID=A0AA37PEN2_9PEZI|nr:uncharacterized protein ColSpa_11082 [Colletotrichum spaethianum]GKT50901.1 hypothetical protein ColSpa_11082 [Colletotrichum spaethianum]
MEAGKKRKNGEAPYQYIGYGRDPSEEEPSYQFVGRLRLWGLGLMVSADQRSGLRRGKDKLVKQSAIDWLAASGNGLWAAIHLSTASALERSFDRRRLGRSLVERRTGTDGE